MIFPLIMVVSVYFLFAGHNNPGGGFAGGLAAGLALALRYLAGGRYELGETLPLDSGKILGVGLSMVAATALASLFLGAPVLSSAALSFSLPIVGQVKLVTSLFFDVGCIWSWSAWCSTSCAASVPDSTRWPSSDLRNARW